MIILYWIKLMRPCQFLEGLSYGTYLSPAKVIMPIWSYKRWLNTSEWIHQHVDNMTSLTLLTVKQAPYSYSSQPLACLCSAQLYIHTTLWITSGLSIFVPSFSMITPPKQKDCPSSLGSSMVTAGTTYTFVCRLRWKQIVFVLCLHVM